MTLNAFRFGILCLLISSNSFAQTVSGKLTLLANETIRLEAFSGLNTYLIQEIKADATGNFSLSYGANDTGIGFLISTDNKPFFLILSGEDIEVKGETLSNTETMQVTKGQQNQLFEQYATEQPLREQAMSAWIYLQKMYVGNPVLSKQNTQLKQIQDEITRLKSDDQAFLKNLGPKSYVSWYLPVRKLVSSTSTIAQYRPDEIPETITAFRNIDLSDQKLYRSGLFRDVMEGHFWLLENSGRSLDSVFNEMKLSIDILMEKLIKDEKKLNEVTDYLFNLLEKRSLFEASEYLSLKVLNEVSCTLNSDLANQLESYRSMKKGNTAPDIQFSDNTYYPKHTQAKSLSEISSKYTIVVFAAGWCEHCRQEVPRITELYDKWRQAGVEVVLVSLDENATDFDRFAKPFPFLSTTDFMNWESQAVKDYYVFGTPTFYLLDDKRTIVLRPNSVQQIDAWVDWNLLGKQ